MKEQIEEMVNAITENTGDTMDFADKYVCAHSIYNAGYRKVPEGAMILTRAELDALNKYQERLKGEDAREIFEEIEENSIIQCLFGSNPMVTIRLDTYEQFKKKYTEGEG